MPGHIFPLRAQPAGVLVRGGQTEASVDLARLAGLTPSGVICEIMSADGSMARLPELAVFGREHGIKIVSVEALVEYRQKIIPYGEKQSPLNAGIVRGGESVLPTDYGEFSTIAYRDLQFNNDHLVLTMGDLKRPAAPGTFAFRLFDRRSFWIPPVRLWKTIRIGATAYFRRTTRSFDLPEAGRPGHRAGQ